MKIVILLLGLFFCNQSNALVSLGSYTPGWLNYQKDVDGGATLLKLNPFIAVNGEWGPFLGHYLVPELGYVMHTDEEEGISKNTIYLLYNVSYQLTALYRLRYGLGTFMTKIKGDGGEVTVPNGTTTITAYLPKDETATSYNSTLNLGFEFTPNKEYGFRLDTYMFQPLSSEERNLSLSLGVTIYDFGAFGL